MSRTLTPSPSERNELFFESRGGSGKQAGSLRWDSFLRDLKKPNGFEKKKKWTLGSLKQDVECFLVASTHLTGILKPFRRESGSQRYL